MNCSVVTEICRKAIGEWMREEKATKKKKRGSARKPGEWALTRLTLLSSCESWKLSKIVPHSSQVGALRHRGSKWWHKQDRWDQKCHYSHVVVVCHKNYRPIKAVGNKSVSILRLFKNRHIRYGAVEVENMIQRNVLSSGLRGTSHLMGWKTSESNAPVDELFVARVDGSKAHRHEIGENPRMRALSGGTVHAVINTCKKRSG